jgi:hypothetical protein
MAGTNRDRIAAAAVVRGLRLSEDELDDAEALLAGLVAVLARRGFSLADADLYADLPRMCGELAALRRRRRG